MALKYQAIVRDIRSSIMGGTLGPGTLLPSTPKLCQEYGVSKITVKRAMDELVREGLVERRRGSGTFVRAQDQSRPSRGRDWVVGDQIDAFSELCATRNLTPSVHLVDFELTQASDEAAHLLGIDLGEPCFRFRRTLLADDVPQVDIETCVPFMLAPELTERDVLGSFISFMRDTLGLEVESTRRELEATTPDEDQAYRLGISPAAPVLRVTQVSYLDDGRAIECSRALHVPDFEYRATRGA